MKKRLSLILAIAIAASMLPGFMVSQAAELYTYTENFENSEDAAVVANPDGTGKVLEITAGTAKDFVPGTASWGKAGDYNVVSFKFMVGTGFTSAQTITQGTATTSPFLLAADGGFAYAGWGANGKYYDATVATNEYAPKLTYNKTGWNTVTIIRNAQTGEQYATVNGVTGKIAAGVIPKTLSNVEKLQYAFNQIIIQPQNGSIYIDDVEYKVVDTYTLPELPDVYADFDDVALDSAYGSGGTIVYDDDAESNVLMVNDSAATNGRNTLTAIFPSGWTTTSLPVDWVKLSFDLKVDTGAVATVAFNGANYDTMFKVSATELKTATLADDGTNATGDLWSSGTSTGITGNYRGWTHFEIYRNIRTGETKVFEEGVLRRSYTAAMPFPTQGVPKWSFTGVQLTNAYNAGAVYIDNVKGYTGNWTFAEADLTVDPVTRNFFVEVPEGIVIADPAAQVSFNIAGTPVDVVYVGKEGNVYKFDPVTALATASTTYSVDVSGIDGLTGDSATFANTASITEVYEDFEGEAGQDNIVNLGDEHGNVLKAESGQLNNIFAYDGGVSILGLTTEYKISFDAKVAGTSGVGMLVNSIGGFDVPFQIDAWNMRTKLWSGEGGWTVAGPLAKPGIRGNFTNWNHFDVVTNVATGFQKIYLNGELVLIEQAEETNGTYKAGTVLVRWASSGVTSYIDNVRIVVSPIGTDVADNFYFGNVKVSGNTVTFAYANPADTAVTGKMILVGYDAEGAIKYITYGDATLAKGEVLSSSVVCDAGYYDSTQVASTAVFFWDGLNTMKPLAGAAR